MMIGGNRGARKAPGLGGRLLAVVLAVVALLAASSATADEFFTVEVPVEGRGDAERADAVARGLEKVLGRMTGVHEDLAEHEVGRLLDDPERFLAGFRFLSVDRGLALEARFDGPALREALGELRVPVWDARRPRILTWGAVDQGGTRRMLERQEPGEDPVYDAVVEAARDRFIPLMFPLMDLEDRARVGFPEIWGGFHDGLTRASGRYGSGPVLSFALRESRIGGWRGRWNLALGGERFEHQTGPGPLDAVVEAGFNWSASRLTERYAAVPGRHDGEFLEVGVIGVTDLATHWEVIRYLEAVSGVSRAEVYRASEDRIGVRLAVERDPERVVQSLDEASRLVAEALPTLDVGAGGTGGAARSYRWIP